MTDREIEINRFNALTEKQKTAELAAAKRYDENDNRDSRHGDTSVRGAGGTPADREVEALAAQRLRTRA